MKRIAIVSNISWTIYNFRMALARAIREAGYEPVFIASPDKYANMLIADGWVFIPVKNMQRTGTNPVRDILTFFELRKIYKAQNIALAFHYHSKPLIYGNLAA